MSRNNDIRRSMLTELLEGQPARKKQKFGVTAPVSTLLLDGQRALEDKRFDDAVISFTGAIENVSDRKADLLYLYDLRSTAYVRLGNLDSALKDSKQMIRSDRADSRGYLKCAQIERSRGNLKEAIRICEYGLNSIGQNSRIRQSLETYILRLREAQKSRIIFEKGTDPMEVLPSELLELIFRYFNYREVVAIMRVCKYWRDRLREMDLVTQSVDTESTRKTLKHEHIKTAFNRLGRNPKKLHVSRLNENAAYFVTMQLKSWLRWESIRSLTIDDPKVVIPVLRYDKFANLQEICFKQVAFRMQSVNDVLQRCPALEHATFFCNFAHTPVSQLEHKLQPVESGRLRSLKIGMTPVSQERMFFCLKLDSTRPVSTNLEYLELENAAIDSGADLSMHTKLTTLAIREARLDDIKTPPSLEYFQWANSHRLLSPILGGPLVPSANMKTLDLKGHDSIRFLVQLIQQGLSRTHLRRMALTSFILPPSDHHLPSCLDLLSTVSGSEELSNVERLILRDDNLRDEHRTVVFKLFPNVQYLELESCSVTEQIVTDQIKWEDSVLRLIVFRSCPKVSPDFDKWARARQVDVEHIRQGSVSSSFTSGGGRRVRYG